MTVEIQNGIELECSDEQTYAFIATLRKARDQAVYRVLKRYQLPKEYSVIHPSLLQDLLGSDLEPSNLLLTMEKFNSMSKEGQYVRANSAKPTRKILDKTIKDAVGLQKRMRKTYTIVFPDGRTRKRIPHRYLDLYCKVATSAEENKDKGMKTEVVLEGPIYGKRLASYLMNYPSEYGVSSAYYYYSEYKNLPFKNMKVFKDPNFTFLDSIDKLWYYFTDSKNVPAKEWDYNGAFTFVKQARQFSDECFPAQLASGEAESIITLFQFATWMSIFADLKTIDSIRIKHSNSLKNIEKKAPRFLEEGEEKWIEDVFYWLISIQMWETDTRKIPKVSRIPKPLRSEA